MIYDAAVTSKKRRMSSPARSVVLLVVCQTSSKRLPNVDQEEHDIKLLRGGAGMDILKQASFADMCRALHKSVGIEEIHMIMHGDAPFYVSAGVFMHTPAFIKCKNNGDVLDIVDPQDFVDAFVPHAVANGGFLKFVFLNMCHSDGYGYSLHRVGFTVVCWSTLVNDAAAADFAAFFYAARNGNASYSLAFARAVKAISVRFDIRDPLAPMPATGTDKHGAGIPKLFLSENI